MVERGRARNTARGRAVAWWPKVAAAGRAVAPFWPEWLLAATRWLRDRLTTWLPAEVAPGRLTPWLAILFGLGIVVYFAAEHEPAWWAASGLFGGCAVTAALTRRRDIIFTTSLGLAALAAGFATVTIRSAWIAHPILSRPAYNAEVTGFVLSREQRTRSDRIVVQVHDIKARRLSEKLERVRVAVRKGTAPPVGTFVSFKAWLNPPLPPLRPGGYDFARDMYFQQIGGSGFVLGRLKILKPPAEKSVSVRWAAAIASLRDGIDARIRAALPGDTGAIASALITGKRDAISAPVNEAMYVSSLAHVLSISGYHMAVVAGVVFFAMRGLLALLPAFASRYPIKKWAAAFAIVGAAFYLILSGAEIATQRSFIMVAIVLAGVMIDRQALTLRTLTIAALAVMLLAPEAVVHPSFQMSFAATLALIAAYERGLPWMIAGADTSRGARIALWGGREILALILASLVAGAATTIYVAFHFHRLAPYGVVANLLAMPIMSAWTMPAGLIELLVMPFGFDRPVWQMMGFGIDWMVGVATWIASLPGAIGHIAAFGIGPLLLATAGLVTVCLLRTPLRWVGGALLVVACIWAVRPPLPDVLVSSDGRTVALRTPSGRLAFHQSRRNAYAVRDWLASDGDARSTKDKTLTSGLRCDPAGCIGRLRDNTVVSIVLTPEAFEEDCRRADLVVTALTAPPYCKTTVIDRPVWQARGALTVRQSAAGLEITPSRPKGHDRPWARERLPAAERPRNAATRPTSPRSPDATHERDTLEADD